MASIYSKGEVIEGDYKGYYVFSGPEVSDGKYTGLVISRDNVIKKAAWGGEIKTSHISLHAWNIKSIEIISGKEKGVDGASVGAAALMFGLAFAAAVGASGKENVFYVGVEFSDGKRSLIKIENALYDIVQSLAFEIKLKKNKEQKQLQKSEEKQHTANKTFQEKKMDIPKERKPAVNNININKDNIEPTVTRIELFLEDREWNKAEAYANAALDFFPTDYRPYLFLLCVKKKVSCINDLYTFAQDIKDDSLFKKAKRFVTPDGLEEYAKLFNAEKQQLYEKSLQFIDRQVYGEAIHLLASIPGYLDADQLLDDCRKREREANDNRLHNNYEKAIADYEQAESINDYSACLASFSKLGSYKDSEEYVAKISVLLKELQVKQFIQNDTLSDLRKVISLIEGNDNNNPDEEELLHYCKKRIDEIKKSKYLDAIAMAENGTVQTIEGAINILNSIQPFGDSSEKIDQFRTILSNENYYSEAKAMMNKKTVSSLKKAMWAFRSLENYKDSQEQMAKCSSEIKSLIKENMDKADDLLKEISDRSVDEAVKIYQQLTVWDYDKERIQLYKAIINSIKELGKLTAEHKLLGGLFQKNARLKVEQQIKDVQNQIAEAKNKIV